MSENNQYYEQDEISLKELIEILINQKKLIASITAIVTIITIIISFFVLKPVYQSTVVLNALPIDYEITSQNTINDIIDLTGSYPSNTIETYVEQIKSPQLLLQVIQELDLKNKDGELLSIGSISDSINISNIKDTNLIKITVSSEDEEKSTNIANTLSNAFITHINEMNRKQNEKTAVIIEEQLLLEEKNLAEKSSKLAEYLSNSISVASLESEINSLVSQITNAKNKLNNLEVTNKTDRATLEILAKESGLENYLIGELQLNINRNIVSELIIIDNLNNDKLKSSLMTIEIVETQNRLIKNEIEYNELTKQLELLEQKLSNNQSVLAEEEYKYNKLLREVALAKQTYDAYQVRHQEAIVAAVADIGSNSIMISSEAIIPEKPISPNKILNTAIGFVLGLMLGVFVACFRAYWKNSFEHSK